MRRVLKWLGISFGVVVMIVILAATGIYLVSRQALNKTYDVEAEVLIIPTNEEAVARGEYLVTAVAACQGCHGEDLSGGEVINSSIVAVVYGPNLTSGRGGIRADFTDEDWVRAIRHGVDREGKPLMVMPSAYYHHLSDEDLAAVIAYLKALPPVDNEVADIRLGPIAYVMVAMSGDDLLSAASIDHAATTPARVEPAVNANYGEYLASLSCTGCHGENLAGGEAFEPGGPIPANLTPGGVMQGYDLDEFTTFLRTGVTFADRQVDKKNMPWDIFQRLTDDDIEAIYLYLLSVPTVE